MKNANPSFLTFWPNQKLAWNLIKCTNCTTHPKLNVIQPSFRSCWGAKNWMLYFFLSLFYTHTLSLSLLLGTSFCLSFLPYNISFSVYVFLFLWRLHSVTISFFLVNFLIISNFSLLFSLSFSHLLSIIFDLNWANWDILLFKFEVRRLLK